MTRQKHSKPKPNFSDIQTDRINILEQIGKTSAAHIKIKILVEKLEKQAITAIDKSFDNWVTQLPIKLAEASKKWYSTHSYWTSRDKLVSSYSYQFRQNLPDLLRQWTEENLEKILKSYAINIYNQIFVEFNTLDGLEMYSSRKSIIVSHHCREKARYYYQESISDYFTSSYTGDECTKKVGFLEGVQSVVLPTSIVGGVGVGARVGLGFLGFALPVIPVALAIGSIASIVNIIGTDEDNSPELYNKIKAQVIELGCTHIKKTELPKVRKDIIERIKREVFAGVINCADDRFACAISQYESIFQSLDRLEE